MNMDIPASVTILDGAFATDGGSIYLKVSGPDELIHNILLTQHLLPPCRGSNQRKTGRLYFDERIVEVRSENETLIISALKRAGIKISLTRNTGSNASNTEQVGMIVGDDIKAYYSKIAEGPEAALRHLASQLIEYVDSPEYVTYAESGENHQDT
jgi:hypothetical protein